MGGASDSNDISATLELANPTHYGDPKTGCESDEQAVRVQGVPGAFCSPECSSSNKCPSDEPAGDTATPQCALKTPTGDKYCALICQPSAFRSNGESGECGTGTCQSIQGVGLCTYSASDSVAAGATLALTNPTHYGDPKTGCESDEMAIRVQGVPGDFCSPKCSSSNTCPSDEPAGDTATPQCALKSPTGDKYCALICQPSAFRSNGESGECGTGTCQSIQGVGLCTYAVSETPRLAVTLLPSDSSMTFVV